MSEGKKPGRLELPFQEKCKSGNKVAEPKHSRRSNYIGKWPESGASKREVLGR